MQPINVQPLVELVFVFPIYEITINSFFAFFPKRLHIFSVTGGG